MTSTTAFFLPVGPTSVTVAPPSATLITGRSTQQFTATVLDTHGQPIANPAVVWSVVNGGGTISQTGLFTAGGTTGTFTNTVVATINGLSASASVTITPPLPAVTAVSPTVGGTGGGTSVTLTGANFIGVTSVGFGTKNATSFTVNSSTRVTATSPSETAGTVDITVVTSNGTSATSAADQFTYLARPTVTGVSPNQGPTAGGASVTITGTGFISVAAVKFGSATATFTVNSPTSLTATAPAGNSGTVDITVTTPGGTSSSGSADRYTYVSLPSVSSLIPSSGRLAGGTTVFILGSNFTGATAVMFGTVAATNYSVNSSGVIQATSPQGIVKGVVHVTVTTQGGTSTTTNADRFTYT